MLNLFESRKLVIAICLSLANFLLANYAIAEIVVVTHPDNTSKFSQSVIKKIFLGKTKTFSNGRLCILLSPGPDDSARTAFNKEVLNKSSNQVHAYWSKMFFTGKGTPPQEMDSYKDIISAIEKNTDAISYIDASAVTSAVKVVATF